MTPASLPVSFGALSCCGSSANSESTPPVFGCASAIAGGIIETAAEAMKVRRDNRLFIDVLLSKSEVSFLFPENTRRQDSLYPGVVIPPQQLQALPAHHRLVEADRKSTRLNSSHANI